MVRVGDASWATLPFDTLTVHLTVPVDGDDPLDDPACCAIAAWLAVIAEQPDDARWYTAAAHTACRTDVDRIMTRALGAVVDAFAGRDAPMTVLDDAADLLRRPDRLPDAWRRALPFLEVVNWFTFFDRYDAAGRTADHLELDARRDGNGDATVLVWTLGCRAELDLRRGRLESAAAAIDEALELSRRHHMAAGYLHTLAARLGALIGDAAHTDRHLLAARRDAFRRGDRSTLWRADAVDGLANLGQGRPDHTTAVLEPLAAGASAGGPSVASVRRWDLDLVEAFVHLDQAPQAHAVLDRVRVEVATTWRQAVLDRGAALLTPNDDGIDAAIASAECFARIGAPFERARSDLVAGELARRTRRVHDARAMLRRALNTFEALHATTWSARARRELAASGDACSAGPPGAEHELTAQEHEVVNMVTGGASNREIAARLYISVKTVESHLTRAYRKLGVASRTQLVAAVQQERVRR